MPKQRLCTNFTQLRLTVTEKSSGKFFFEKSRLKKKIVIQQKSDYGFEKKINPTIRQAN